MLPEHLRFDLLKQRISIECALSHHGLLERMRIRGPNLVGPCPLHNGDRADAFVVHRERNLWHCFTACNRGGDVIELVRILHRCSYARAAFELARMANTEPMDLQLNTRIHTGKNHPFIPFTRTLSLDPIDPFIQKKGIAPETARALEVGRYRGPGFLEGCIGVRLHDPEGRPLGYLGRRIESASNPRTGAPTESKWKCPPGLPKGQLLYNWHRTAHRRGAELVVVECPWSVLRLHALGIPAVALLGVQATGIQQALLATAPILLLLDGDPAGRAASLHLEHQLRERTRITRLELPCGMDPDDLDDQALGLLVTG